MLVTLTGAGDLAASATCPDGVPSEAGLAAREAFPPVRWLPLVEVAGAGLPAPVKALLQAVASAQVDAPGPASKK
jgi:hypothetical protein